MGNRLADVKWFTEFENPTGDPLACAAASIRIVQNYTAKQDPMTAEQILAAAKPYNKSRDPGLDPGGDRDDPEAARPEQQLSLLPLRDARRGDEVRGVLAGAQRRSRCTSSRSRGSTTRCSSDSPACSARSTTIPANTIDAGRRAGSAARRHAARDREPPARQVPHARIPDRPAARPRGVVRRRVVAALHLRGRRVRREHRSNDGAYTAPHWAGQFVLLVDDGDAEWPSDREGRSKWH